jgi:hypothetical protein
LFAHDDWLERFDDRLKRELGIRLETTPARAAVGQRLEGQAV